MENEFQYNSRMLPICYHLRTGLREYIGELQINLE